MESTEAEIRRLCGEIRARIIDNLEVGQRWEIPLAIEDPVTDIMRLSKKCDYHHAPIERFPDYEAYPDSTFEQWQCCAVDAVKPKIWFGYLPDDEWWQHASVVLAAWVRRLENGTMLPEHMRPATTNGKTLPVTGNKNGNTEKLIDSDVAEVSRYAVLRLAESNNTPKRVSDNDLYRQVAKELDIQWTAVKTAVARAKRNNR